MHVVLTYSVPSTYLNDIVKALYTLNCLLHEFCKYLGSMRLFYSVHYFVEVHH